MHLIATLAAGVNGASNGSVSVYKRGTQTFATVYTSFEAAGPSTPTAALTLDTNGGRVVYVNEEVECIVKDSSGNVIRDFVAGDNVSAIEAITQSFTGVDYSTGQSGASKPVTMQTILDLWKTSAGAIDFKVLVSGVATTLQTMAQNTTTAVFYNVKASTYGAVGDGSTDDTSAIQAAATAASAAGGGTVYFPPGTYKVTSGLTFAAGVTIQGASSSASTIAFAGTFNVGIQFTGTAGVWTFVRDLNITQTSGQLIYTIYLNNTLYLRMDGCKVATTKAAASAGGAIFDSAQSNIMLVACTIDHSLGLAANDTRGVVLGSSGICTLIGCSFLYPATFNGKSIDCSVSGGGAVVFGCDFQLNTITAGTSTVIDFTGYISGRAASVVGNHFRTPAVATVTPIAYPTGAAVEGIVEAGNTMSNPASFTLPTVVARTSTVSAEGHVLLKRQSRYYVISSNAASLTLPTSNYGTVQVVRTSNAIQTVNFDTPPGAGHLLTLVYNNNNAAVTGTITMGTGGIKGLTTFTVNANTVSYYHFKSVGVAAPAGAWYWSLTGSDLNEAP